MRIELLWFDDCPNHDAAGAMLREVLAERGAATEVENATAHRGGPAASTGALEDERIRTVGSRFECRGRPGAAESDHEHIDLLVPA